MINQFFIIFIKALVVMFLICIAILCFIYPAAFAIIKLCAWYLLWYIISIPFGIATISIGMDYFNWER